MHMATQLHCLSECAQLSNLTSVCQTKSATIHKLSEERKQLFVTEATYNTPSTSSVEINKYFILFATFHWVCVPRFIKVN